MPLRYVLVPPDADEATVKAAGVAAATLIAPDASIVLPAGWGVGEVGGAEVRNVTTAAPASPARHVAALAVACVVLGACLAWALS